MIRHADGVEIRDDSDQATVFDRGGRRHPRRHRPALLADPSRQERSTLGAFGYSRNETWLHTDDRLLPAAPGARASWNYLLPSCHADPDRVLVSYDINRLQALPTRTPHLVTLNATDRIDPNRVLARMTYEHPIYTTRSVAAQRHLPELNDGTIAFAGAYHGWGFHEDGCRAGVAAAHPWGSLVSSAPAVPALYDSVVMHSRRTPLTHRFRYRGAYWLVDLDRLPQPSGPYGSSPASAQDHLDVRALLRDAASLRIAS